MIYAMAEIPCRTPPGTTVDTRLPLWSGLHTDLLLGVAGACYDVPEQLWKYKTLEFAGDWAIERIFVSTKRMCTKMLTDEDGNPVKLYTPHIKIYYQNHSVYRNRYKCDTFRIATSIRALLRDLGADTDLLTRPEIVVNEIERQFGRIDTIDSPDGVPLWLITDIVSEGFPTPEFASIRMADVEPQLWSAYASSVACATSYFKDGLTLMSKQQGFIMSDALKHYLHPSYNTQSAYHVRCPKMPVSKLHIHGFDDEPARSHVISIMAAIAQLPYSDIKLTMINGHADKCGAYFSGHQTLSGFMKRIKRSNLSAHVGYITSLRLSIAQLVERMQATSITVIYTWTEEMYITFHFPYGYRTYYFDCVLWGDIGTNLLVSGWDTHWS